SNTATPAAVTFVRIRVLSWLSLIAPERAANWPNDTTLLWTAHGLAPLVVHGKAVNPPDSKPSVNTCARKRAVTVVSPFTTRDRGFREEATLPSQSTNS